MEKSGDNQKNTLKPGKKASGILSDYKNPAHISQEKSAWEMAVKEKNRAVKKS